MATVTRDTKIVTKQVSETVPVINLTLSLDEAQALRAILNAIGGERKLGREHADSILAGLRSAAIVSGNFRITGSAYFVNPTKGDVYFDAFASSVRPF